MNCEPETTDTPLLSGSELLTVTRFADVTPELVCVCVLKNAPQYPSVAEPPPPPPVLSVPLYHLPVEELYFNTSPFDGVTIATSVKSVNAAGIVG